MILIKLIENISAAIWSLPPFRQYKGNFFYYFLFVGLADPLVLSLRSSVRMIPSNIYYVLTLYASLVAVISLTKKIKWKLVIPVLMAVLALGLSIPNWDIAYIQIVILALILYYSIRYVIIFAEKNSYVSLFHFLFLIYNASLLLKLISAMVDPFMGPAYYYSTTIFDIMLGILFCILREEDKRFALSLRGPEFENSPFQTEIVTREHEEIK